MDTAICCLLSIHFSALSTSSSQPLPLILIPLLLLLTCTLSNSTLLWMTCFHTLHPFAHLCQSLASLHPFRSLNTKSFRQYFCPRAAWLPPIETQANMCFGRQLSPIRDKWPRKQNMHRENTEESLCCLAICRAMVLCFYQTLHG